MEKNSRLLKEPADSKTAGVKNRQLLPLFLMLQQALTDDDGGNGCGKGGIHQNVDKLFEWVCERFDCNIL